MSVFRRNVSWQFFGSVSQAALSGITLLILGRHFGAEDFGYFSIVLGIVSVANLIVEPRMQDLCARALWDLRPEADEMTRHKRIFLDLVVLETLIKTLPAVALLLLAAPIARLSNLPPGGEQLLMIAAAGQFFWKIGWGASVGVLRVLGRADQLTYCMSAEMLVRILAYWVLSRAGLLTVMTGILTLAFTLTISNCIQLALASAHVGGMRSICSGWRPAGMFQSLREHRRLLASSLGLSAADLMNKDLDVALLSSMVPAQTIGIYKMAKNIALLVWRAVDPFYLALMPELSRRVLLRDFPGTKVLVRRSMLGLGALATGFSTCAYLVTVFFSDQIFGPEFSGVEGPLGWMLLGVVVSAPLVWSHPLAVAFNRNGAAFVGSLIGSATGLLAFFGLVRPYGINGAAISWSLTLLPGFLFTALVALRFLRASSAESGR